MADREFNVKVYRQADGSAERPRVPDLDFKLQASNVDKAGSLARARLEDQGLSVRMINHSPNGVILATVRGARKGAPATVVARVVGDRKKGG
jgi:hypothetical protein